MKFVQKHKTQKARNPEKKLVNAVKAEPSPKKSVIFLKSLSGLNELDYSSGNDNMVATIHKDQEKIEPLNMPIQMGNISTTLLADSKRACSILNELIAAQLVKNNPRSVLVREINNPQLRRQNSPHWG